MYILRRARAPASVYKLRLLLIAGRHPACSRFIIIVIILLLYFEYIIVPRVDVRACQPTLYYYHIIIPNVSSPPSTATEVRRLFRVPLVPRPRHNGRRKNKNIFFSTFERSNTTFFVVTTSVYNIIIYKYGTAQY